jgi:hypothetical protein
MQPYFYPYIGYFELIQSVDHFVFLDDAQYTRGWINRNRIRSQSDAGWSYLTVPINKHSNSTSINEITIHNSDWKKQHYETLKRTYSKNLCHEIFKYYFETSNDDHLLIDMLCNSIKVISEFLDIAPHFSKSSDLKCNSRNQQKIIDICLTLGATEYLNLPGGKTLYDTQAFQDKNIQLKFMELTKHHNMLSILDCILGDNLTQISKNEIC